MLLIERSPPSAKGFAISRPNLNATTELTKNVYSSYMIVLIDLRYKVEKTQGNVLGEN